MIGAGQRVSLFGLSGDGKTRWEMAMLAPVRSCVIFDDKQDPEEWAAWAIEHGYHVTADPEDVARHARVLVLVDDLWLSDREGWRKPGSVGWNWSRANELVFARGNTVVVFADAHDMLPSSGANPMARKVMRQGRSKRISVLMDFQRPMWADTFAVKLSDHCISMRMMDIEDLEQLRKLRRPADPAPLAQLEQWAWGHHALQAPEWTLYDPNPEHWEPRAAASKQTTLPPSPEPTEEAA